MTMQSIAALSSSSITSTMASTKTNAKETKNDWSTFQTSKEKIPWTTKEKFEEELTNLLKEVQRNMTNQLNLTVADLGQYYEQTGPSNTLSGHQEVVSCLTVLPNGFLASGSEDTTIKFWDTSSGQCLSTLVGHSHSVNSLIVLLNGSLASASSDTTIKLWRIPSGQCLSTLKGHSKPVYSLAVLPNGALASGSWDTTIKLWHIPSGQCLSTLEGHSHSVTSLAVLPNGTLASGSEDTTIKFWDTSSRIITFKK